ncbi:ABC transporter substrate-binding protein [Breznakiella homolactica]|uniref:Sugar ABC transporter substrate-binding protein n=1 Tax=Breznakiella homolactica TaxID=2798577 RepID=A0A7T7XL46_9SPIR|nr:sugar ABC transporter substrate-binding protein [Breznakiella homolactica]QQO08399.1 sugar ABC transporter substrate-binding protein [Breznakiella homolactica]
MRKSCLVLLAALLLVFSSCSGKKDEKIVLTWYQWFDAATHENVLKPTIAEFEALHPNVKIELAAITNDAYWDRLSLDIASGVEGDIVTLDTGAGVFGYYSQRQGGAFIALDDYIKGYVLPDGTRLEEDILLIDSVKQDGKIVALPYLMFSAPVTAYRVSDLRAAGVDPKELDTWDSYYEAARKLTRDTDRDGRTDKYGFGHPSNAEVISRWWHMHWLWTMGGGIFPREEGPYTADRLIFNSPQNVQAIEFLKKLRDAAAPSGDTNISELHTMFANGAISTIQIATWTLANFANDMSQSDYMNDVGMVPFPAAVVSGRRMEPVCVSWGNPLAISSKCKNPKEAFDFIAFLHSKDAQKREMVRASPTNKLVYDEYSQLFPKQAEMVQMVQPYEMWIVPDIVQWNQFDHVVQQSIKSALLGTKSVQAALDDGQAEMVRILGQRR